MSRINTLRELAEVGCASYENLASRTAKDGKSAKNQIRKDIQSLIKAKLVKRLTEETIFNCTDFEVLYAPTKSGIDLLGIDVKRVIHKAPSLNDIFHESAIRDIIISFIRNFPDFDVSVTYPTTRFKTIHKIPDAIIWMEHKITGQKHNFILEVERKEKPDRTYRETVKPYFGLKSFKKEGLEYCTKILIVYSYSKRGSKGQDVKHRVQDKNDSLIAEQQIKFDNLMNLASNCPPCVYFLPFKDYANIHLKVWKMAGGNKVTLI